MARGRMISKSLSTSEKYAGLVDAAGDLAEFCHALYPLLVIHTDDFGRMQGDAWTVKSVCYPASRRSLAEFETALGRLTCIGLIAWYEVLGKKYLQIQNFENHQLGLHKRTRSQFPRVPGISGNVTEIPDQENLTKEKRREESAPTARGSDLNDVRTSPHRRRVAAGGRATHAASAHVDSARTLKKSASARDPHREKPAKSTVDHALIKKIFG